MVGRSSLPGKLPPRLDWAFCALMLGLHALGARYFVGDIFLAHYGKLFTMYVTWALGMGCYGLLVWRDPGNLPNRGTATDSAEFRRLEQQALLYGLVPPDREGVVPYCSTCQLWRPLRSGHCRATDRCVARFDHFCSWTWTPIGAGNHRLFLFFILMLHINLVLALICLHEWWQQTSDADSWWWISQRGEESAMHWFCTCMAWFGCLFSGVLLLEQTRNAATDSTVRERIKQMEGGRSAPASSSWSQRYSITQQQYCRNLARFILRGE